MGSIWSSGSADVRAQPLYELSVKTCAKIGVQLKAAGIFVADVFDEQHDKDVVFILTGIHAAAQFIAAGP